jgi:hypothetical protein
MKVVGGKNMEGMFFYWFAWIGWTAVTFLMEKQALRTFYACALLFCVLFSTTLIEVGPYMFSGTFICFLFFVFLFIAWQRPLMSGYLLLSSFITMTAYAGFCLFELFDPVWIFMDRKWIMGFLLLYIVCMLVRETRERIVCLIMGMCYGDILFAFILNDIHMYYTVGAFPFLDIAAISCTFLLVWTLFSQLFVYIDLHVLKYARSKVRL